MEHRNSSLFLAAILAAVLGIAADGFIRAHFQNSIQSDEIEQVRGSEQARAVYLPVPARKPRVLIAAGESVGDAFA